MKMKMKMKFKVPSANIYCYPQIIGISIKNPVIYGDMKSFSGFSITIEYKEFL
jgi:hypothetical protein